MKFYFGANRLPLKAARFRNRDDIAPGRLVIAQEILVYGWRKAIVIDRKDNIRCSSATA
jgi:hypothetical protein